MDVFDLLANSIYHRRILAGLSQDTVAERMGIDRSHFSRIERGAQNIELTTFQQLCIALEAKPADLFDESAPPRPRRASPNAAAKSEERNA